MQAQTTGSSVYGEKVMSRYTDGYRLARTIVGFGTLVKNLGIAAAALILLVGLGVSNSINSSDGVVVVLPIAGLVWLIFWALGVLVSAQGQVLKANIDEAG